MPKQANTKDFLQRDVTKLWYTDFQTQKTYMVYQYANPMMVESDPERMPLYVGIEGMEGMELGRMIEDYMLMKKRYNGLLTAEHDNITSRLERGLDRLDQEQDRRREQYEQIDERLSELEAETKKQTKSHWWR